MYLETRGRLGLTHSEDTPLGQITIYATGLYRVDWGDGTKSGPYNVEGAPWPEGAITHLYSNVGIYNIVVREDWSARLQFGNDSGVLAGLHTEGRIDDFRVEQIQAVVTAG